MQIEVELPTLHPDQVKAYMLPGRFKVIRCGRRWGKTELGKTIAGDGAIKRKKIGWFAPEYKILSEAYNEIVDMLEPIKSSSSKTDGVIRTTTGGRIDFWSLENERAGRSRKYHEVLIDEGAFTKANMMGIWEKSIKPTLLDYGGKCTVMSNTNGSDPENFLWRICNEPKHGFKEYHAPTHSNPYLPKAELDKLINENHPLVYQQEYLAEFVDWSGVAFFSRDKLLIADGKGGYAPLIAPDRVDAVFAVVDSAVKTGKDNDGTAVVYYSYSTTSKYPLVILDWDIVQIEGALLETWLPTVFKNLELLARSTNARMGSLGAHIEDKSSGTILIQQAKRRGWPAHEITSELTALGKDERAISTSGYVYREKVKVSAAAYNKVSVYKTHSRNHLMGQVLGFRVGDKKAATRADDLLDCFTYGIALSLGDYKGF
jgi:hypothetical protein